MSKRKFRGFLGGPVVKNLPCNAEFNPWSGKIPHAVQQLSLRPTTETTLQRPQAATSRPTSCSY